MTVCFVVLPQVWDNMPELINNEMSPKLSYALFGAASVISLGAAAYTIKAPESEASQSE